MADLNSLLVRAEGDAGDEANDAIARLERWDPMSEADWRILLNFFQRRQSVAWARIITERFLRNQPSNIPALLSHLEALAAVPVEDSFRHDSRREVVSYSKSIVLNERLSISDIMRVASAQRRLGDRVASAETYSIAVSLDKANVEALQCLVDELTGIGCRKEAAKKLALLRQIAPPTHKNLLYQAKLALWMNRPDLIRSIGHQILSTNPTPEPEVFIALAELADDAGCPRLVKRSLLSTDILALDVVSDLERIAVLASRHDIMNIYRNVAERLSALRAPSATIGQSLFDQCEPSGCSFDSAGVR